MFAFLKRGERGQTVMFVALLVPILLGMTGLAVDSGSYASDRRELQRAADAIALAAAQELPDRNAAIDVANQWAVKNGINPALIDVHVSGGNVAPKVRVTIDRNHDFAFMPILGVDNRDVSAAASAIKVSFGGGAGVVPWAVENDAVGSVPLGDEIVIKYDANNPQNGNFGPIRIDGPDAAFYESAAKFGAESAICADPTPGCDQGTCPGAYPGTCAETSPECDGEVCRTKPGNMTGPTRNAVDHRIAYTSTSCDTFGEVFSDPDNDGVYSIAPDCNPWTSGPGHCDTQTELCSRRLFIIPVIDQYPNGSSVPVTVLRFALVFLEGYENGRCGGSFCEIKARFVKAEVTTGGLSGTYDPGALVHFVRLSE